MKFFDDPIVFTILVVIAVYALVFAFVPEVRERCRQRYADIATERVVLR